MTAIPHFDAHPRDFFELLKPRVMYLSIFTAFCGMCLAKGQLHPWLMLGSILCIAIGAGASGCLNMWCEIHRDAHMQRTQNRPLPAGRIDPNSALAYGVILAVFSVTFLGLMANWLASFMLAFTIFSYVIIYTLILKPRTPQNIVIGGASGAFPPIIGWICVTGSMDPAAWVLFLIIFFWTPAHFWALCLDQTAEYQQAGFPMYPGVYGERQTKSKIIKYIGLTFLSSLLAIKTFSLSMIASILTVGLCCWFLYAGYELFYNKIKNKRLFFISIVYLFLIFLVITLDVCLQRWFFS